MMFQKIVFLFCAALVPHCMAVKRFGFDKIYKYTGDASDIRHDQNPDNWAQLSQKECREASIVTDRDDKQRILITTGEHDYHVNGVYDDSDREWIILYCLPTDATIYSRRPSPMYAHVKISRDVDLPNEFVKFCQKNHFEHGDDFWIESVETSRNLGRRNLDDFPEIVRPSGD